MRFYVVTQSDQDENFVWPKGYKDLEVAKEAIQKDYDMSVTVYGEAIHPILWAEGPLGCTGTVSNSDAKYNIDLIEV